MIKGLIGLVIIVLLVWLGVLLWHEWDKYNTNADLKEKERAAAENISEMSLSGMPPKLEATYQAAQKAGVTGIANFLNVYGPQVEDPRRAWIEMDYMVMISGSDPKKARVIFSGVRSRIPTNSPIYPRIKQLEKTYN